MLATKVHEIRGVSPVYKVGDKMVIDDPKILLHKTDALCTYALSTLLHCVTVLEHEWCPAELGLTTPEDPDRAYMQCVDAGEPYTEGGTVIFESSRIEGDIE